jgi:hypothetical protein
MSHGISIYNATNNIIINQDFSNYHLVSTGTIANGGSWPTIGVNDLLFIRLNTAGATAGTYRTNRSSWSDPKILDISSGLLEYVTVRRTPSPFGSQVGLRVYRSDGVSIAFDSGAPGAKIVSSVTRATQYAAYPLPQTITINQPFAVPAGRKRYITGQHFVDEAYWWIMAFGFFGPYVPQPDFELLKWNSDMQQEVKALAPSPFMLGGAYNMVTTKIWLTIDI